MRKGKFCLKVFLMKMEYKMQDTYLSVEANTLPSTKLPRICLIF